MKKRLISIFIVLAIIIGSGALIFAQQMFEVEVKEFYFYNKPADILYSDTDNIDEAEVGHYGYDKSDYIIKIWTKDGHYIRYDLDFNFVGSDSYYYKPSLYLDGDYIPTVGDSSATLEVLSSNSMKFFIFDDNASMEMVFEQK
ncbi:MAG: hypothetical protein ACOCV8_02530 [Spirochaetota bacterium]